MIWVLMAAGGIALATFIGTVIGYFFRNISQRSYDTVIGFSAGIMLCAAVFGLIEPSMASNGVLGVLTVVSGIVAGALFLYFIDKLMPDMNKTVGIGEDNEKGRVLLLVSAIAIHHFPEGIAAGVSFGTESASEIILVCTGIAIQNIPEAALIIAPLLNSGVKNRKALFVALISGGIEIIGTFLGYFAINTAKVIMPFALAFAGGSMLYIIIDEMIPQTHAHSNGVIASYSALVGFCVMLGLDALIGGVLS